MRKRTGRLLSATLAAGLVLSMGGAALAAPPTRALKQFRVPTANSDPRDITNGADGARWFTEGTEFTGAPANIGRVTPAGAVTEFSPGVADGCNDCILTDIEQGPGNLLYITSNDPELMRFNVATQSFLAPVAMPNSGAVGGQLAVSGNIVWITDFNNDVIWRYDSVAGTFTSTPSSDPGDVAVDGSGNAWFTEPQANLDDGTSNIGRIPAAGGAATRTRVDAAAAGITVSPADGKIWFVARFPNGFTSTDSGVGYLDPSAGNSVSFFPVPITAGPFGIAAATDGTIWFTQTNKGNAASITNAGAITEFKAVKGSSPEGITVAPNGDPWYAMRDANKIAALVSK